MTTIKATCPFCGDVDLTPGDLVVTRAPAAGWATYSFGCPDCGQHVRKPAPDDVVDLLAGAGVAVRKLDIPDEALEPHDGEPIGADDLIEFVLSLGVSDRLVGVLLQESRH
jgi:hypothetical protein